MLSTKQRSITLYSLISLFLLGAAWIIITYFSAATLTILTSDASNTITVQETSPNPHPINVDSSSKQTTIRLEPGSYIVIVGNNVSSAKQVLKLSIGEHKTITLSPGPINSITGNLTPITTFGADAFVSTSGRLSFIDRNDANYPLYTVDSTNRVSLLGGSRDFQAVKWADINFGIGLTIKGATDYGIAKIDNLSVSDVKLPFTIKGNIGFAVAPNHTWYVSDGKIIYRANGDGSFTKIFSSTYQVRLEVASNNAVEFTQQPEGAPRPTSIAVLQLDGTKYQIEGEQYESQWSPSGDKVIMSGDITGVFDAQLNKISGLPDNNVTSPIWLDANTIIYIKGSDIWSFSLTTGKSEKAASIDPLVGNFSSIRLSDDQNYVYASVDRQGYSKTTLALYRYSINDQQAIDSTIPRQLGLVLPTIDNSCSINSMSFAATSVIVKQNAARQNCVDAAKRDIIGAKVLDAATVNTLNFQNVQ